MPTEEDKDTGPFPGDVTGKLKAKAAALGFTLAGILPAGPSETHGFYLEWLKAGYAGEMAYLHRHADLKRNPSALLPAAPLHSTPSLVALAHPYPAQELPPDAGNDGFQGRISRYARGTDYHKMVSGKLASLAEWLESETGTPVLSRGFVDSGPVMEREMAARAGLGWVGKNAMLIHWEQGSWLFLAELLVLLPLTPDRPRRPGKARTGRGNSSGNSIAAGNGSGNGSGNGTENSTENSTEIRTDAGSLAERLGLIESCGSCTACIDACPTGAIVAEKTVDSRLCISYLTIELKGPIPMSLREGMGDWVFGCDVCQEVCHWNQKTQQKKAAKEKTSQQKAPHPKTAKADAAAIQGNGESLRLDLAGLLGLDDDAFRQRFRETAIWRTKRRGLLRNAAIALGNLVGKGMAGGSEGTGSGEAFRSAREALGGAMGDPEPLVRGAAAWALGRFQGDETARETLSKALAGESHPQVREEITGALHKIEIARPG